MRLIKPNHCRILLLLVLLGFTALTLHTSMHTQADPQNCEICGGHFNPSHALAPAAQVVFTGSSPEFFTGFLLQSKPSRPFTAYHQRAPPVLI